MCFSVIWCDLLRDLCMAARAYFNKLGIITVISVVLSFFCDVYLCILEWCDFICSIKNYVWVYAILCYAVCMLLLCCCVVLVVTFWVWCLLVIITIIINKKFSPKIRTCPEIHEFESKIPPDAMFHCYIKYTHKNQQIVHKSLYTRPYFSAIHNPKILHFWWMCKCP